ncbi:MAG TPA: hypothetical protein VG271_04620 [Beijerinckiaceae bacterium]|jgi:hypothetical protein|nr:hypothetical protein [Beijerinckiaceae bacterium]
MTLIFLSRIQSGWAASSDSHEAQVSAIVNRLASTLPENINRIMKMLADFQSGKTR